MQYTGHLSLQDVTPIYTGWESICAVCDCHYSMGHISLCDTYLYTVWDVTSIYSVWDIYLFSIEHISIVWDIYVSTMGHLPT